MQALVFDTRHGAWETTRGFEKREVPEPVIDEKQNPADADAVVIKVSYAGVCGSDRGIWTRTAFRDAILASVAAGDKTYRILGHEFFGEVADTGSRVSDIRVGDMATCESHVVCTACYQCQRGEQHVCTNEKILGISHDGGFAEYVKVPRHIVWVTDTAKIRPEVAAMQEPFGNAVHAASKVDLSGKNVAIFGLGPIGMFLTLVARGMGAASIIGVEPNPVAGEMARELGIDYVIPLRPAAKERPYAHDAAVTDEIMSITKGVGADVSFEMAGFNSSVNNCLFATRRGGDVILFGIKHGDFVLEDYNRLIVRGFTLHAVIGRQLWRTWETTRRLLQDPSNTIQEKMWNVILRQGQGTVMPITDYTPEAFEKKMTEHPKILLQF
ncbi:MAG: alcohol dehydrogenase catalytic domain-containing protein [Patescibacteria group bacterium]